MKYPALDIHSANLDLLLAVVDDFSPTAVDEQPSHVTVFFHTSTERDAARQAVQHAMPLSTLTSREVDDEDWARRSQDHLGPITVGRIVVTPPTRRVERDATTIVVVIAPSMGFGTGHHATTRLCLAALQRIDLTGRSMLDIGTGSGVLAIAARMLGAVRVRGVDIDPDAIHAADENLLTNPVTDVCFMVGELGRAAISPADVVTANLTGALLIRSARTLSSTLTPDGTLIVSGLQADERADVVRAFEGLELAGESVEDDWVALTFNQRRSDGV